MNVLARMAARGGMDDAVAARVPAMDWDRIAAALDDQGHALIPGLLAMEE